jgi:hypothetical protein
MTETRGAATAATAIAQWNRDAGTTFSTQARSVMTGIWSQGTGAPAPARPKARSVATAFRMRVSSAMTAVKQAMTDVPRPARLNREQPCAGMAFSKPESSVMQVTQTRTALPTPAGQIAGTHAAGTGLWIALSNAMRASSIASSQEPAGQPAVFRAAATPSSITAKGNAATTETSSMATAARQHVRQRKQA